MLMLSEVECLDIFLAYQLKKSIRFPGTKQNLSSRTSEERICRVYEFVSHSDFLSTTSCRDN